MLPFFVLAHGAHHLITALPAPLLPFIRNEFNLDYTQAALVITAFTLSYGFSQLPAGWLADRLGARVLIAVGICGVALMGLLVSFSNSYILMLIFLALMRTRFLWWPFHPVGYVMANTPTMKNTWTPFMIAWLVKAWVLRYGGAKLYRRLLPFFLGLIVGAVPGFSAANTIIILLPLTLAMDPEMGLVFMVALYASSRMGAGIPAILVNIPGTAGAAATPLDGYPMTKQGRGQQAFHAAPLHFPDDGERGEEGPHHGHDDHYEARDDEVLALQVFIEPKAGLGHHRGLGLGDALEA